MEEQIINAEYDKEIDSMQEKKSFMFRFIFSKKLRVFRYFTFWVAIYFGDHINVYLQNFPLIDVLKHISCVVLHAIIILITNYLILPKFFFKNKYFFFILTCIILESIFTIYQWWIFQDELNYFQTEGFVHNFLMFINNNCIILGSAVGIKLFKLWYVGQIKLKKIRAEKFDTEMKYLKNQMNPHFLFNALNNILVMHQTKDVDTENSIIGLSELLKYQLYDCSNEKVPLKMEIKYIENFINIEKIRKKDLELNFKIIENDTMLHKFIEPLLFTPIIENAFKHSRKNKDNYFINILLVIDKDSLFFSVENSKAKHYDQARFGGIGIENIQRRLNLVFGNSYKMNIKVEDEIYITELSLNYTTDQHQNWINN